MMAPATSRVKMLLKSQLRGLNNASKTSMKLLITTIKRPSERIT